jgi:GNAT superfamily N-acetyltransferase
MINYQIATKNDIDLITQLAIKIWNAHYVSIIGQKQVDYMLNWMYSAESLLDQMIVKKHQFYLIRNENQAIGFFSFSTQNNKDYFIHKFYIDQQISNTGIGSKSLNYLIEVVNPKSLTLTVNRSNFKSINFYFKNKFKIDKVEDFDIGNGYVMNDFVMVREF